MWSSFYSIPDRCKLVSALSLSISGRGPIVKRPGMSKELNALLDRGPKGGEKANKALLRRQLRQLKEQLPRLNRMIQQAKTAKDVKMFERWRAQLIKTLKKEGIKVPATKTKECVARGEAHRWLIKGDGGTCKKCSATRTFERQVFAVTTEHRNAVLDYIKSQSKGKCGPWSEFAKSVGVSSSNLGVVVRAMLEDGTISEPAGKGSITYIVVPNNKKAREAAIKLYAERRQAEDSPKVRAPVSLEERREAKARKAA